MPIITEGINGGAVGANSCRIVYPAGATEAELLDVIEAFITAHGWELWDAAAGADARAYRAACQPDRLAVVEYKYIVIRLDGVDRLYLEAYESWDEVAHTGLNPAYNHDHASYCQRYDSAAGGTLNIYSHSKWLALQSDVVAGIGSLSYGAATCVFEVRRDNPDFVAGAAGPPFVWVNHGFLNANNRWLFSPLRTRFYTGSTASLYSGMSTELGQGGYNLGGVYSNNYGSNAVPKSIDAFGGKIIALSVLFGQFSYAEIWGRIFGLTLLTAAVGSLFGDETTINMSDDHVAHPDGTPVDCWVVGCVQNNGRLALPK